ncbi:MAG: hypothetical protein FWD42_08850 [Solirubrobacterales bacterium]|nr:hypothetical protein [Solirubrobacterales bacterium]
MRNRVCRALVAGAAAVSMLAVAVSSADAHSLNLKESASMHKVGGKGFTINESGNVSGSIKGKMSLTITVSGLTHVTARLTVYPSGGGSINGTASGSYRVAGAVAHFSGTANLKGGSGKYKKASGSGLKFSGVVHRGSDAVSVSVSGNFSY